MMSNYYKTMKNGGGLKSNSSSLLLFHIPPPTNTNCCLSLGSSIQLPKHKLLLLSSSSSFHLKVPSAKTTPTTFQYDEDDEEFQEDEDEDEDEFEEDEDEEEDGDIFVPLRQWTRNKPRGFGEGKVYDTTLEDKLLEELDQSRAAQLANLNNLRNNPTNKNSEQAAPNGIRVRLVNLPKKKNIHRDLQAAFKPFPGIINILPAVSGNHNTREPLCKGFAFVHFNSHHQANRFVDVFSTQPITFGKVQKQIRCEIVKPSSPNQASVKPSVHRIKSPLPVLSATMAVNSNPVTETPLVEDAAFDMLKIGDDDLVSATDDNTFGKLNNVVVEEKHEVEVGSEALKKQNVVREKGKKTTRAKKKVENTPKLNIPGSAKRLKMKEKALLSGVFSKYGGKSSD